MKTWLLAAVWLTLPGEMERLSAVTPSLGEFETRNAWANSNLSGDANTNSGCFAFVYHDSRSAALWSSWSRKASDPVRSAEGTRQELLTRDPVTGLEVRVDAIQFPDFPAVEWVVSLSNTATTNTAIIEDIQALDAAFLPPARGQVVVHWSKGAVASFDDFAPQQRILKPGTSLRLEPGGGRSSSQVLPFFNVEGPRGGAIMAVGWSGEWAAKFDCDAKGTVSAKAGLARTHLRLFPGETIRTPRILLLFYEGDQWRGQNLLRQFLLAHHRPTRLGKPLVAPITCGNWGGTRAEVHLDNIHQIIRHELPVDYYWIDAEWFGHGGWPVNVGNWEVKKDLYPAGFKPLSDALRDSGRELMLWFEPERVYKDTPWYNEHRDWLLDTGGESLLLNLGQPSARKFLTEFISAKVQDFGLGCYRQDFNIDPLPFWNAADAADRQGMTEIRYIEGLYAFWDDLRQQYPGLLIDNCASGGRRIDLETLGRATPFWRTDGPRDPIAHQCHTMGLLGWVPLSATSQDRAGDNYEFRSSMCSALCLNWWVSGDAPADRIPSAFPFDWAKSTLEQYLRFRDLYYGEFYPLTAYSQATDAWMAYELNRPDLGKGLVVVLRRPASPYGSLELLLKGLDGNSRYKLTNLDTREERSYAGTQLLGEGLNVALKTRPGSALLLYEKE